MADCQHDAGSKTEGAEVTDDLVKRLREHAIHVDAWGKEAIHDANIIEEAADRIEKLEAALRSIAANACCDSCREAALVARKALEDKQ